METIQKIGLIVEGDTDKAVVEVLVTKVLGKKVLAYAVSLGDRHAYRWAYSTVLRFLEKDYCHVIALFDADTTDAQEIRRQAEEIRSYLRPYQLEEKTSVLPVVREIESWLLADKVSDPEKIATPKRHPTARSWCNDPLYYSRLAEKLDLETARKRSPSLDAFMRKVTEVVHHSGAAAKSA